MKVKNKPNDTYYSGNYRVPFTNFEKIIHKKIPAVIHICCLPVASSNFGSPQNIFHLAVFQNWTACSSITYFTSKSCENHV